MVTPKGRELLQAGQKCKCVFLSSGQPTYWPTDPEKVPDLIDFFVAKGVTSKFIHVESNEDLSSDHSPVTLTLSETVIQKKLPRFTNKKTNWNTFRGKLLEYINLKAPLETKEQIDKEVEQYIADV